MQENLPTTDNATLSPLRERLTVWAEVTTIFAVAAFFAFAYLTGRVENFVAPQYRWLSAMAAVALLAMGLARLVDHCWGGPADEEEDHGGWNVPVSACIVVLICPIVLGLKVDPQQYSVEGSKKRRVTVPARDIELQRSFDWALGMKKSQGQSGAGSIELGENPTILDLLMATVEGGQEALDGQVVTVVGQCDLPDGPRSARFDLYRLVVTCCVADATGVAVEVHRRPTAELKSGGWVRVQGVIRFDSRIDPSQPVIHAKMTTPIQKPSEPYL